MQPEPGDIVRLRAFREREIVRRVVGRDGLTVHVCSEAEYQAAQKAGRKPECVGFPSTDVIGIEKSNGVTASSTACAADS
jgi:hypothetical protein